MRAQLTGHRRWRVLDDGVLAYGLALLRTLWLWPLLQLAVLSAFDEGRYSLAPWVIFGLLAGGTLAAQLAARRGSGPSADIHTRGSVRSDPARPPRGIGAVLAALCGLAALAITVYLVLGEGRVLLAPAQLPAALAQQPGRALLTLLLAGGLWWWGLRTGSETVAYDMLSRNFLGGLVGLLFVVGVNAGMDLLARPELLALLLAYLALGLFLLALASIQATRRYERAFGDHDLPLPGHWWATVAAVVAMLLLAALVLSWFFVPEMLGRLAAAAAAVLASLGQVAAWLIMVISYPVFLLVAWLASLLTIQPLQGQLPELMPPPAPADPLAVLAGQGRPLVDPALGWVAIGVLAMAAIAILFVLAMRRYRTAGEDDVAETHEGILSVDLLKAQLAELLRRRRGAAPASAPYLALAGDDPATRVRHTYQQLLQWAAAHGHARAPGLTPDHYCELLAAAYPAHRKELAAITAAYRLARYGAVHVTEDDAVRASAAWQQMCATDQPELSAGRR